MRRARIAVAVALMLSWPLAAYGQAMPGMDMTHHGAHGHGASSPPKRPTAPVAAKRSPRARVGRVPTYGTAAAAARADEAAPDASGMSGMGHDAMSGMDHAAMPGMDMSGPAEDAEAVGTALPAGNAPAPPPPRDHYADRSYGAAAMAASRAALSSDHGGMGFSQVIFNIAEHRAGAGRDGYRWDGEAWFGGDVHRLALKTEGEGAYGRRAGQVEMQALYSRAIDPYWNLQAGFRYDARPDPSRAFLTARVEGLAPYWFDVEAALFLSDRGDLLARLEGYHDMRITQRLILQPRAEINLAAQDVRSMGVGSGLVDAELGLRLRYEVRRDLAPYLGISHDRKFGDTARFARAGGEGRRSTGLVVGIRSWF